MNKLLFTLFILLGTAHTVFGSFISPASFDAWKANKAYENNNFEQACSLYKSAIEKRPSDVNSLYNLGKTYYKQNNYEEAAKVFDAVTKNPIFSTSVSSSANSKQLAQLEQAYFNKGDSLFKLLEFQNAIDSYEQVLKINSDNKFAKERLELAKKYLEEQKEQEKQNNKDKQEQDKQNKEKQEDKKSKEQDKKEQNKDNKSSKNGKSGKDSKENEQNNKQDQQDKQEDQDQKQNNKNKQEQDKQDKEKQEDKKNKEHDKDSKNSKKNNSGQKNKEDSEDFDPNTKEEKNQEQQDQKEQNRKEQEQKSNGPEKEQKEKQKQQDQLAQEQNKKEQDQDEKKENYALNMPDNLTQEEQETLKEIEKQDAHVFKLLTKAQVYEKNSKKTPKDFKKNW